VTFLSININKIALLRNARGANYPNVIKFTEQLIELGIKGITMHPRPDARHITATDVSTLAQTFKDRVELNIEGNPLYTSSFDQYANFEAMVVANLPTQLTIVPDSVEQKTSDHGCDMTANFESLKPIIERLKQQKIRISIFIDPNSKSVEQAAKIGADAVELYTGPYAENKLAIDDYHHCAKLAKKLQMRVNAGHDLNLQNLGRFISAVQPDEVSIGHAFTVDCIQYGLANTVEKYLALSSQST